MRSDQQPHAVAVELFVSEMADQPEVSMIVSGAGLVTELDRGTDDSRENSRKRPLEERVRQPPRSQLLDGRARLTSALQ